MTLLTTAAVVVIDIFGKINNLTYMSDLSNSLVAPPLAGWRALLDGFSLEVLPAKIAAFDPDPLVLPPGSLVFLPHLHGQDAAPMGAACRHLVSRGLAPVPHLAARHFATRQGYQAYLETAAANGARHLLVLGGDRTAAAGPYASALDLIDTAQFADTGIGQVMIGGYIEKHPRIGAPALARALRQKLDALEMLGCKATIVSQFGFDPELYVGWVKGLRQAGVTAELRLGVAGVCALPMLIKYAVMCGIGPSLSMLRQRSGAILNMLAGYTPQELIQAIAAGLRGHGLDHVNIHFFPFGGATKTLNWVKAVRRDHAA